MTDHPERAEDYKAIRAIAEQAIAAQESAMVNPWRVLNLLDALTASEKRASEAERTFADLRNLIAVNLAANAELERERDEARGLLSSSGDHAHEALAAIVSERDEAVRRAETAEALLAKTTAHGMTILHQCGTAERERDEVRAALGKIRDSEPGTLSIELRRIAETALTHTEASNGG